MNTTLSPSVLLSQTFFMTFLSLSLHVLYVPVPHLLSIIITYYKFITPLTPPSPLHNSCSSSTLSSHLPSYIQILFLGPTNKHYILLLFLFCLVWLFLFVLSSGWWNLNNNKGANNNNKTRMQVAVEKGGFWAGKVVHGGLPQTTRYEYWRTFTTTMELDPRVQSRFRGSLLGWGSTVRLKARMSFIGSRTTKLEKGRRKGSPRIIIIIMSPCKDPN